MTESAPADARQPVAHQPADPPAVAAATLGSKENPVRCDMPAGERAYLDRLRCPDGSRPPYQRLGSYITDTRDHMIDGYRVLCGESETMIYMDMYHPGYVESEPVPGFDIVP